MCNSLVERPQEFAHLHICTFAHLFIFVCYYYLMAQAATARDVALAPVVPSPG
jgi:hypothetical protein